MANWLKSSQQTLVIEFLGGYQAGSLLKNPRASQISHACFSQGVSLFFGALLATHPPLKKRILRLDPRWDGKFTTQTHPSRTSKETTATKTGGVSTTDAAVAAVMANRARQAWQQIGQTEDQQITYARSLLAKISQSLLEASRVPGQARAIIYGLVLSAQPALREQQLQMLEVQGDHGVAGQTRQLLTALKDTPVACRLPLLDLCLPTLRQLSTQQYTLFRTNLVNLIRYDNKIGLFEWTLQKNLLGHLDAVFHKAAPAKIRYQNLQQLLPDCNLVFSLLAHTGQSESGEVTKAFNAAIQTAGVKGLALLTRTQINLTQLDAAVDRLNQLAPLAKPGFLKAGLAVITADNKVVSRELELIRALSACINCPMPPIIFDGV